MGFFISPVNRPGPRSIGEGEASPIKKGGRKVEPLLPSERKAIEAAWELSRKIQKNWNSLPLEDLAGEIVDLEERVTKLSQTSEKVTQVKRAAERLHFQFVFPISQELDSRPRADMPASFAKVIGKVAERVFKTQSLEPLKQLNSPQIKEIMRQAKGGG